MKKNWHRSILRIVVFLFISLYIFFYIRSNFPPQADAQVLPQLPLPTTAVNGIIQSTSNTVNSVVPTVTNLLNTGGAVTTINKTVNNLITPQAQEAPPAQSGTTNLPAQQGSTSTTIQYPGTSNTYYSTSPLQTNNPNTNSLAPNSPGGSFVSTPNRKDILILNHENTASGRIILTKDINEVIFLSDSLDPTRPPLTFIMPTTRNIPILFNFGAFLQTDSSGQQHITLPQGIVMDQTAGSDNVSVALPANEDIALSESDCGGTQWDGTFTALTILTQSSVTLKGENVGIPIAVGRNDCSLDLSKQARIFFMNRMNWSVGYLLQNQGNFTKISSLCPITTQRECYTDEGENLVVNTYHFTEFIVFNNLTPLATAFSFLANANIVALILAIILTLLLAIILGNWRVLIKMGTIAEVNERKNEYVSTVSHELRTPLTAIKGFISMLLSGDYGPVAQPMEKPLKEVQTSAQRSINLVNEVLDVSRIESGKTKLTITEFPIDAVISEAIDFLTPLATEKKLSLSIENLDKTVVQGDQEKVRQLIINLISNAIKYTDHGKIVVSTKEGEETSTVFVSDTGLGIPQEDQARLFKQFERINTNAEGTGLGLYLSKKLAHKMGGDVYLEKSEKGVGSTFALSLLKPNAKLAKKLLKKTKT